MLRDLAFESQIDKSTCGAACISMVLSYFDLPRNQTDIWSEVRYLRPGSSFNYYCRTVKLLQYLLKNGISAMCISTNEPISIFNDCLSNNMEVVILHHFKETVVTAHFSVLTGMECNKIFVNDPVLDESAGKNRSYHKSKLVELMKKTDRINEELGLDNTILIIENPKFPQPIRTVDCQVCQNQAAYFNDLNNVDKIICPNCDNWIQI